MRFFSTELSAIRDRLVSDDQPTRLYASLDLLKYIRAHPDAHATVREVATLVIDQRKDAHSVNHALRVIGLTEGAEAEAVLRLLLLNDPRPMFVKYIVQAIEDRTQVPMLINLLRSHGDSEVRIAIIRLLGRWQEVIAFDSIAECLKDEKVRPHAVEALADLGDRRAIEPLQNYLSDKTEAWEIDNHGPMLRVCDLAKEAIEKLQAVR